ncbi:MAG: NAD(P)-dependent oxidoreductase [Acidimicrobiaceae bacterium]|nr:NAD(P)-dependent oxidoreductase [Acidimicrobiaceae bacterium]MXW62556.1 NAD(P)-dependent oxidoreductase [Acidimicrobiaceae bacterium]MYA73229.1 NAD(P)-dependent oxidoreductase [Acidimicrobiaceae bacterium]MYC43466.1 NAD(P)-dependent oxidoreductase [Acidimicrobiaceae bacterium]MYG55584.1 NAD(P)-dependent oxidoreductase [Acidimicrobiaceae bacterium]
MRIGFVGLGNLGSKLAGSLLRNGVDLVVRDLDEAVVRSFIERGATSAASPKELAERCDVVITCLPSPATCAEVMEAADGVLAGLDRGKLWLEMSTTDESEVRRLATLASERGAMPIECPVSGGCHRAATGNISIFCGGTREAFDLALPILAMMGRKILHTGPLGSASILKVVTNYLASVNLVSIGEAFAVAHQCGIDLTTAYEAIHISSGTSFVHETEGQVILNGSYDIGFTLDLVQKDMSLFMDLAERAELPLEVAPVVLEMFNDAATRYGSRALSPRVVQRYEDAVGAEFRAPGFPAELIDDEPEQPGYEVVIDPG